MKGHRLTIDGKTDRGRKRSKNEDNFLIEPDLGFMIVADGMGGHASGEVASRLATELCSEQMKRALQTGHVPVFFHVPRKPELDPRSILLGDCVKFANQAVFEAAQNDPTKHNMGTTLVCAHLARRQAWRSPTWATAASTSSRRKAAPADGGPQLCAGTDRPRFPQARRRREVASCATCSPAPSASARMSTSTSSKFGLTPDDTVLLCSDGLTKMLDDDQIESVFKNVTEAEKLVDELIKRANEAGGGDNITVVIAKLESSRRPAGARSPSA